MKSLFEKFQLYSIAIDESVDSTDSAQLLIYIRGISSDFNIAEELAQVRTIKGTTKGVDFLREVLQCMAEKGLSLKNLTSVTTDGCPSMIGKKIGFVTLLQKEVSKKFPTKQLLCLHCIIHQESLVKNVLGLGHVTSIVNAAINNIRGSKLKHREFKDLVAFVHDANNGIQDIKYHTKVRWLSLAEVVKRFYALLLFLSKKSFHNY